MKMCAKKNQAWNRSHVCQFRINAFILIRADYTVMIICKLYRAILYHMPNTVYYLKMIGCVF